MSTRRSDPDRVAAWQLMVDGTTDQPVERQWNKSPNLTAAHAARLLLAGEGQALARRCFEEQRTKGHMWGEYLSTNYADFWLVLCAACIHTSRQVDLARAWLANHAALLSLDLTPEGVVSAGARMIGRSRMATWTYRLLVEGVIHAAADGEHGDEETWWTGHEMLVRLIRQGKLTVPIIHREEAMARARSVRVPDRVDRFEWPDGSWASVLVGGIEGEALAQWRQNPRYVVIWDASRREVRTIDPAGPHDGKRDSNVLVGPDTVTIGEAGAVAQTTINGKPWSQRITLPHPLSQAHHWTLGTATTEPAPPEPEEPSETGWPPAPLGPRDRHSFLSKARAHIEALAEGREGEHLRHARSNLAAWERTR